MNLFDTIAEMGHEQVVVCHDKASGYRGIIAIHDTTLGPALGGTRFWNYASDEEAVVDALRLARERRAATLAITSDPAAPLREHADVALFTAPGPGDAIYGETVTSKWAQLLVVDALYAAFASRHYDETLRHLEASFATVIRQSRT